MKIIGEQPDAHAQGYFVYDSRKSGAVTVSHLRFGSSPIRATYLVDRADFVAVHQFDLLTAMKTVDVAKPGATLLLNSPHGADTWDHLPGRGPGRDHREAAAYLGDRRRSRREGRLDSASASTP